MTAYAISHCDDLPVATVHVHADPRIGHSSVMLHDMVEASLDVSGDLLCLDIQDTEMFGAPFDQAAAHRAVEWAREILAGNAIA